jgi:hypothetical protein
VAELGTGIAALAPQEQKRFCPSAHFRQEWLILDFARGEQSYPFFLTEKTGQTEQTG